MKPVLLVTERLVLRRANENDPEDLFHNYLSDPRSSRFLTREPHSHVDQAKKFLNEWCSSSWDKGGEKFAWVVAFKTSNIGIGVVLVERDSPHVAQMHFGISYDFAGQGLMTEGGGEVMRFLMDQEKIRRVWALCDVSNHASRRVLEKLGFQCEGLLLKKLRLPAFDNVERDCYLYGCSI